MGQSHGMNVKDPCGDPGETTHCPPPQRAAFEMSHPVPSLPCVPLTTTQWMLVSFLVTQELLAVQDAIGIGVSVLKGKLRQSNLHAELSEDTICGQVGRAIDPGSILSFMVS